MNYVNAPALAAERQLRVTQTRGLETADYANMISCRVSWNGGQRLVAGTLFGGVDSRLVLLDEFRTDARPRGQVLIMFSRDVPGVIGIVGTLLFQYGVNIAEWRLGRDSARRHGAIIYQPRQPGAAGWAWWRCARCRK